METPILPPQRNPISDADGLTAKEWYLFFWALQRAASSPGDDLVTINGDPVVY